MVKRHFPNEIDCARLILRKHELASAPLMFASVESDRQRLSQFLPWVEFTGTVDDEVAYVYQTHGQWDRFEMYDYSLFRKSDGAYIGNAGVHNISWLGGCCELGYWILGEYEGQGYMTEAARALTDSAFANGFHRVEIRCSSANVRSAGVPRRLDFRYEARLRESTINQGKRQDTLVYAVLQSEWGVPRRSPVLGGFAVVFTSRRTVADSQGYAQMATRMEELALLQPGFLGVDSVRGEDGLGITVSYWQTEEAIAAWREQIEHRLARSLGREVWYEDFSLRVCRVERESL